jgi:hypothetical protein
MPTEIGVFLLHPLAKMPSFVLLRRHSFIEKKDEEDISEVGKTIYTPEAKGQPVDVLTR